MNLKYKLLVASSVLVFTACKNNKNQESTTNKSDSLSTTPAPVNESPDATDGKTIKAKFVSFDFGDAAHYRFSDEAGKPYEFTESHDSTVQFAVELPEKEANEQNQGWGENKSLIGKWFNVTYKDTLQMMYPGGGMDSMMVILKVSPAK